MDISVCAICGESKDPRTARFKHVRLGLDEPPEPVLCKCKDPIAIVTSISNKFKSMNSIRSGPSNTTMEKLEQPNLNSALIDTISSNPIREVELRLDKSISESMFKAVSGGAFGSVSHTNVREVGCIVWTGEETNLNVKVRKRSTGEAVVKVTRSRTVVAPGYTLAISDEYPFSGRIMHAQYDVNMTQVLSRVKIRDCNVTAIARKYVTGDKTSYAAEFEIDAEMSNVILRSVLSLAVNTIGIKKVPNSMDVVRRAIASAQKDPNMNAILLDITAMSFSMRERVYAMAQARAPADRKVIVTFGVGRFQEWKQMMNGAFSYIAIDPNIEVEELTRKAQRVAILPYDFRVPFKTQIISMSKRGQTILWCKCKSEDFIRLAMPTKVMSEVGIPAVFSFSISYHITVINRLRQEGVHMFGCGYTHDNMKGVVGEHPVTIVLRTRTDSESMMVTSTFGKSTYVEPILKTSAVPGLFAVKDVMPEMWKLVDSNTNAIMEKAVIMSA